MWGAGCVFAEMFEGRPILEGKSDLNQAQIIFELVGSPNEATMPGWSALPGCEGVKEFEPHRGNVNHRFRKCVLASMLSALRVTLLTHVSVFTHKLCLFLRNYCCLIGGNESMQ